MKYPAILLFFFLSRCMASAQTGINFFKGSWQQALAYADSAGKVVFVDVYTTWCKPCKMLEQQTFHDAEVAQFMNTFFVNYRTDAEREGKAIAREYNVRGYPTMLFVKPDSTLADRLLGFMPADMFLSAARDVFGRTAVGGVFLRYDKAWQEGQKTLSFATAYFGLRHFYGLDNSALLDELLKSLPADSLALPQTKKLVVAHAGRLEGRAFDYLCEYGSSPQCAFKINHLLDQFSRAAIAGRSEKKMKKVLAAAGQAFGDEPEKLALKKARLQSMFYLETGKVADFVDFNKTFVPQHLLPRLSNPGQSETPHYFTYLDNAGWQYIRYVEDTEALREALDWMQQAIRIEPSATRMGYAARIAMKSGQKVPALEWLNKAIAFGKAHNEDVGNWESLLADYSAN